MYTCSGMCQIILLLIYFVYSLLSIYWTFTTFIGQCTAWLAVSTPLYMLLNNNQYVLLNFIIILTKQYNNYCIDCVPPVPIWLTTSVFPAAVQSVITYHHIRYSLGYNRGFLIPIIIPMPLFFSFYKLWSLYIILVMERTELTDLYVSSEYCI